MYLHDIHLDNRIQYVHVIQCIQCACIYLFSFDTVVVFVEVYV